jgi:hypothetical protein
VEDPAFISATSRPNPVLFSGCCYPVKLSEHEADHSAATYVDMWSFTYMVLRVLIVLCVDRHKGNFSCVKV